MTALLAIASSLVFGASDFGGGLAARRESVFRVTVWSQITSLLVGLALVTFIASDGLAARDLWASLAAGVTTAFSVVSFYAALSRGAMSVIAPTTGVIGAAVPAVFGIARGDATPPATAAGLVIAIFAIVLVTRESDRAASADRGAFVLAAIAGLGFGLFFVALEQTGDAAGIWPLVIARFVSVPVIILLALRVTGGVRLQPITRRLAVVTGATEMIANILILVALRRGPLAVAGVFGSLYPIGTVVLAWVLLRERLGRVQFTGVVLAIVALVLVAA